MISFLLGMSITLNIILLLLIFIYLKIKSKQDFLNSDCVVDKNALIDFFSPNYKI